MAQTKNESVARKLFEGGGAVEQFDMAVREKMAGGMDRQAATRCVVLNNPSLHKAFLAESNARTGRHAAARAIIDDAECAGL